MRIAVTLLALLLAASALAADSRGIQWQVAPSTAACLGINARVDDLYILEIPRGANVTIAASGGRELILLADEGASRPRTIDRRADEIAVSLEPGRYYVGVASFGETAPYSLTLTAPELFGSSTVDLRDKSATDCPAEARPTISVAQPANRPPTVYEALAADEIGALAGTPNKRHRAATPPRPCTFSVSATSQSVTSNVGTGSVGVTASRGDCGWGATSSASWLTITGTTGPGNGSVNYSFVANTSSSSRTGTITAAGKSVSVTQFGACSYTLSPTSADQTSAGGSGSFGVSTRSDCTWTASVATASASWLTITSGQSGTGNGTVSYSAAANTSTSSRSGSITAGGRTFTVNQAADISSCTYTPGYTTKTLSWCGGERNIQVTTQGDCPWTATSNVPWLSIILASRSGSRALSYTVEPNATGATREATLTIAGKPVRIVQNARAGGGTYDGNWSGTTSSNRAVSLCVADNAIQNMSIAVRLDFPTFACFTPLIRQSELPITGSSFSGTFITFPEVANISTNVRGTFTSSTAMNGSWDSYSGSFFIICGSTVSIGTAGTILSPGTFTATKQP